MREFAESGQMPREMSGTATRKPEAWFLGPKGENADVMERLVVEAIRDQAFWRRNFHPSDPVHISEEIKRDPEFLQAMDSLQENYRMLLAFLKKSVPFFSMRYQGHMNWELTLPSILGYFAATLYNPNNVAFEGSTATTILEMLVGDDICRMLGYELPTDAEIAQGAVRPWGHITCDGTVANIEAIWAARNVKFYPVALQQALKSEGALAGAKEISVRLSNGGEAKLAELDNWQLLNLAADDVLALPERINKDYGIAVSALTDILAKYSLQNLGMTEFANRYVSDIKPSPVFLVPGTKHYSFPKAAAVLGIGASNMIDVAVDNQGRMDIDVLRQKLQQFLDEKRPVYTVVAVIGTTEESAIDPIADVVSLRDEFRSKGLDFTIHADAAWGGYHRSVINDDFDMPAATAAFLPPFVLPLSEHSTKHLTAIREADSITVDPHKSGYIPYPAGALCYRNSAMRNLVTFSAPVVFHGEAEPTVGIYGIEGSKPGAAAAAVYLSHRVIRPSKSGYGQIIGQALYSCKKLYARLLCMASREDPASQFYAVPLPLIPQDAPGLSVKDGDEVVNEPGQNEKDKIEFIRRRIVYKNNEELNSDELVKRWLPEYGPDENILAYAFNFRGLDGEWNKDLAAANR
ncbi:MAG: decarboxylase, partial [Pyrinomonadaceae bacterium]|nr:decarboxylase [Pyrinomonadaceae bacterium]